MNKSRLQGRYRRIVFFFWGVILRFIWWELILARMGFRSWVRRTRPERFRGEAVRFRGLAIQMGGVMIKVGQFLSSRLDVLPPEVTDELAGLQDEVPAESYNAIRELAETELGGSLSEKFEWFDQNPLAAASLGQVHRARLNVQNQAQPFRDVVVKIQRPYIEQIVEVDLAALSRVGRILMRYRPVREHADVPALLREFSATVREEIDYLHEAQNAAKFYEMFKEDPDVHVPRIVNELTTLRVLTLEDVYAIKITDYEAITAAGISRSEVAERLFDTYLKQIFEDGFVHADPHPGNLFVTPLGSEGPFDAAPQENTGTSQGPRRWQLTFVDFGMTARVHEGVREGLRDMLIGVGTKDASRVVDAYEKLGMILPSANLELLKKAEAQVFARFWGMSMSELRKMDRTELRQFAHQYRDLMYSMPFQVPQNLIMLGRTVAILSGMCTGLDPNFNLWTQVAPYARKLVEQEATKGLDYWLEQIGELFQTLLALPAQTSRVLAQAETGGLTVQVPQISRDIRGVIKSIDRLTSGVVFTALLLGGVFLYNAGNAIFGESLLGLSGLLLLWMLFMRRN